MSRAENGQGTGHRVELFGPTEAEQLIGRAGGIRERAEGVEDRSHSQTAAQVAQSGEDRMKMRREAKGQSGRVETSSRPCGAGLDRKSQFAQDVRAAAQTRNGTVPVLDDRDARPGRHDRRRGADVKGPIAGPTGAARVEDVVSAGR